MAGSWEGVFAGGVSVGEVFVFAAGVFSEGFLGGVSGRSS